ncbi:MAG: metallophosphoesterase [Peptococcaceae bacterium]|nr:metallophosphoesterase [Peptococcaceae bacterium]
MKEETKEKPHTVRKGRRVGRTVLMGVLAVAVGVIVFNAVANYVKTLPALTYEHYTGNEGPTSHPDVKFAVISDLHFYDRSLGTEGAAFEEALHDDRKMFLDAEDLLDCAIGEFEARIDEMGQADIEFVLIPGDLTKDGERINHDQVASRLQVLVDKGIQVCVVPGNHDINNPGAVRYVGDGTEAVDTITADDFARIYANMGYGSALMRDENSLSYVVEPIPGLWILGLDGCRYRENQPGKPEIVSGRISQETEYWLGDVLNQAVSQKKSVMVLTHHGIVEHWPGQAKLHPDYLFRDYEYMGRLLASYHVKLVFTGHYHAQNIAVGQFDEGTLYDVETGSLVTAPSPLRFCTLTGNALEIESVSLVEKLRPDTDFAERAREFARDSVIAEAYRTLRSYKVPEEDAKYLAEAAGDGFMAHYYGDVDLAMRPVFDENKLGLWARAIYTTQLKYVMEGLWEDLSPGNNSVVLLLE